ncbi:MAG TPA: GspH/FimT family pseudopilin [Variovorax sp.]|nr:GspH/FimT family pseudopilin [Variovorax sp.]
MLVTPRAHRRRIQGFTLVELLTAVTLIGVLAGLAVPSFQGFIANQRIRNVSFDLMAGLLLARSEAVTRNGSVSFRKAEAGWTGGWTVTDGTNTLLSQEPLNSLSITSSATLDEITYGRDGRANTASTKFNVAPARQISGVSPRCISIGPSGLPSSRVGACS